MSGNNAGASWKSRREAMGKTVDDAAQALRISKRFVQGIEEGNYDGWPEKVFSAGFIRSYAKYLSVDPGSVLAEYEGTKGKVAEEQEPTPAPPPQWLEREKERGSRKATYVTAAGVVLLVGLVLVFVSKRGMDRPPPSAPVAAPSAPAADTAAPPGESAAKPADHPAAPAADNAAAASGDTAAPSAAAGPKEGARRPPSRRSPPRRRPRRRFRPSAARGRSPGRSSCSWRRASRPG